MANSGQRGRQGEGKKESGGRRVEGKWSVGGRERRSIGWGDEWGKGNRLSWRISDHIDGRLVSYPRGGQESLLSAHLCM